MLFTLYLGSVQAVNINPGGLGEAIILPYYTVNNGLNTLFTINNTTNEVKAVKVHIREGKKGLSVLSFNVYLAPYDMWSAGLVSTDSSLREEQTAAIHFSDQSCTPFLNSGQEFSHHEIEAESSDTNLYRTREGYIEIFEMGSMNSDMGAGLATTFTEFEYNQYDWFVNNGVPEDCGLLESLFSEGGGWHEASGGGLQSALSAPTGVLSASAGLIDVAEGIMYSFDGTVFEHHYQNQLDSFHTTPGDTQSPSFEDADLKSLQLNNGELVAIEWEHGYQAISSLLLKTDIYHEYEFTPSIAGITESIFTFPTKRFYLSNQQVEQPFENHFTDEEGSCEPFTYRAYSRNTDDNVCQFDYATDDECPGGGVGTTPAPNPINYHHMCWATNVIPYNMNQLYVEALETEYGSTPLLGSTNIPQLGDGTYFELPAFENGRVEFNFNHQYVRNNNLISYQLSGLPVMSVAFQKYTNAGAQPGLLAQYGGTQFSRFTTKIESEPFQ